MHFCYRQDKICFCVYIWKYEEINLFYVLFLFKELVISIPKVYFIYNQCSPYLLSDFFQWPHSPREIIYHAEETKLFTAENGESVTKRDAHRFFFQLKIEGRKRKRLDGRTSGVKDSLFQGFATPTYMCGQEKFQRKRRKEDEE